MKKIGIIGGLGPEATIDYYKRIITHFHQCNQSLSVPEIIIYSVDMAELFGFVEAARWDELAAWITAKLSALAKAGADFAVISANTPHIVFERVLPNAPLPLISIVEATLASARSMGLKRLALLGTRLTMQSTFFADCFGREGLAIVVPDAAEQAYIHEKLFTEIELGIFREETRQGLMAIVAAMQARDEVDGVILGCTELPLILDCNDSGIPFLNTTAIHVEAICRYCR